GIQTNGASEVFTDFESLRQSHVRAPCSRRLDRVLSDVAARAGQGVLQDDISRFVGNSLQSTGRCQAGIDCGALWIRDFFENIAKVQSTVCALCPLDTAGSVEIERPDLVRSSTTVEVILRTDC